MPGSLRAVAPREGDDAGSESDGGSASSADNQQAPAVPVRDAAAPSAWADIRQSADRTVAGVKAAVDHLQQVDDEQQLSSALDLVQTLQGNVDMYQEQKARQVKRRLQEEATLALDSVQQAITELKRSNESGDPDTLDKTVEQIYNAWLALKTSVELSRSTHQTAGGDKIESVIDQLRLDPQDYADSSGTAIVMTWSSFQSFWLLFSSSLACTHSFLISVLFAAVLSLRLNVA